MTIEIFYCKLIHVEKLFSKSAPAEIVYAGKYAGKIF